MGTCMVIDGTNMVHRAYHAMESTDLRDEKGEAVWAVHGLVNMLANFTSAVRPSSLVVAFDAPGGCPSRKALAPSYKEGRSETPAELRSQLLSARVVLGAMGVVCIEVDDWEADDVLASVVTSAGASGARSVVVSSDKDAHQLVDEHCLVYKPEGKFVSDAELVAKYSVTGGRWVEFAALVGEGADNLVGVNGIGPKRAAILIGSFGDVEEAIGNPGRVEELVNKKVAEALVAEADVFRRNRQVGTLRRDLGLDLSGVRLHKIDPDVALAACEAAGLSAAGRRFSAVLRNALG